MDSKIVIHDGIDGYDELKRQYARGELEDVFGPLRELVTPGDKVLLKPNLVRQSRMENDEWEQIITHPAVIECALDAVLSSLQGDGEVIIADAPQADADFDSIMRETQLNEIARAYSEKYEIPVRVLDFREEGWILKEGVVVRRYKLPGDPRGYCSIDLGSQSEFFGKRNMNYYGADYDVAETHRYHNETNNIYVFSKTALEADLFVNLPKIKTHKLAGMTGCMKNIVGACIVKNSLPHHTIGGPSEGGDQFDSDDRRESVEGGMKKVAIRLLNKKNPVISYPVAFAKKIVGHFLGASGSKTVRNGSWHGNDTIWRAVLDLNKILLYCDKKGVMQPTIQRKYYAIEDGIIAGEGTGPLSADAKAANLLIAGTSPLCLDAIQAGVMGLDKSKIPSIEHGFKVGDYPLSVVPYDQIEVAIGDTQSAPDDVFPEKSLNFVPHFGWVNCIAATELER